MKKSLVLALVLVLAFAATSLANPTFSGEFTSELKWAGSKLELDKGVLKPEIKINLNAAAGDDNWSFSASLGNLADSVNLASYVLTLNDDHFTAYVFRSRSIPGGDKSSRLGFVSAPGWAWTATVDTLRVVAPVAEVATVTFQTQNPTTHGFLFVDGNLAGHSVGFATRLNMAEFDKSLLVGYGTVKMDPVTVDVEAGIDLSASENNLLYGVRANVKASDQVTVAATFTGRQANVGDENKLNASLTFEEVNLRATAGFTNTAKPVESTTALTVNAGVRYRLNTDVAYANLFHNAHWFKVTAAAFGLDVSQSVSTKDVTTLRGTFYAGAPVLTDMLQAKLELHYANQDDGKLGMGNNSFAQTSVDVRANLNIKASSKLSLTPRANFVAFMDGVGGSATEGSHLVIGTGAVYGIGSGSASVGIDLEHKSYNYVGHDLDPSLKAEFKVTVRF